MAKKRFIQALNDASIQNTFKYKCRHKCLTDMSAIDIKRERLKYHCRTQTERQIWLMDMLSSTTRKHRTHFFKLPSGLVCQNCFRKSLHINKHAYYLAKRNVEKGAIAPPHPELKCRKRTDEYLLAMNWFEDYVSFYGDRLPDVTEFYLPYRTVRESVHANYVKEMQESGQESPIARSTFLSMWRIYYPHIKIKQVQAE